jgi:hypothetical protein
VQARARMSRAKTARQPFCCRLPSFPLMVNSGITPSVMAHTFFLAVSFAGSPIQMQVIPLSLPGNHPGYVSGIGM